jgi:Ser/Thr protein kinase RdoA (MazF antagonist)
MTAMLEEIVGAPLVLEELKRKPGRRRTRRAVGSKRRAIVKAYESERAPIVAARLRALAAGPPEPKVPEVLHEDPSSRVVVLSELVGAPLRDALLAGDLVQCRRAGAALGTWHAFWLGAAPPPLAPHTCQRELEILLRWAERADPGIAEPVRHEAASLAAEWPIATVVHRDLYEDQILLGRRVGLIDLDDAALGPPELDVGNLLAHIELLELRTGGSLAPAIDALLEGYGAATLDRALLDRCRRLTLLRLACIHGVPECVERARGREERQA